VIQAVHPTERRATVHDTMEAGFRYPAVAALRIADVTVTKPMSSRRAAS
jgi:hypothetical protein